MCWQRAKAFWKQTSKNFCEKRTICDFSLCPSIIDCVDRGSISLLFFFCGGGSSITTRFLLFFFGFGDGAAVVWLGDIDARRGSDSRPFPRRSSTTMGKREKIQFANCACSISQAIDSHRGQRERKKTDINHPSKRGPWRIHRSNKNSFFLLLLRREGEKMSFEPWKPGPINPFCVLLCVLLLIETSGWEPAKRWREGERKSHHRWRDIELYLLGGTQHGVLFGAVLSRRNRPSDGWGSWLLVPLRMCCAPTTHSHTPIAAHKRASREREGRTG